MFDNDEGRFEGSAIDWTRRAVLGAVGAGAAIPAVPSAQEHEERTDGEIGCGEWTTGELTEDDPTGVRSDTHHHDTYTFEALEALEIEIWMLTWEARFEPYLYLLDPNGNVLVESEDLEDSDDLDNGFDIEEDEPGGYTMLRHRFEADGEYTIVATSVEEETFFNYELDVTCYRGEGGIGCGDVVTEALTEDDDTGFRSDHHYHDLYTFQGTVGETIFVDMWVWDEDDDRTSPFPYLYLLDPNGNVVAEGNEGFEWESFLSYDIQLAGEYTLVATSIHEETFFEYRLYLECFRRPTPIECGETVQHALSEGVFEAEHFFQARSRDEVTIRVTAADDGADFYLLLLDPEWNVVAQDDDSGEGLNPLIEHRIQRPGQYTILVANYGAFDAEIPLAHEDTFRYELELTCEEGPPLKTEPIACGDVLNAALTADDETGFRGTAPFDAYSLPCSADTFLAISMTAVDGGDPYLYLLDPDGNVVAEDDDSGEGLNSLIAYRTETAGEFTIIATSYWGGFGEFPEFENDVLENEENGLADENDTDNDDEDFPGSFFDYELEVVCCPR